MIKTNILLILTAILISGCANQYDPSPDDTILSNRCENRPNWIDENDTYSEQGLSIRSDDSFGTAAESLVSYANK